VGLTMCTSQDLLTQLLSRTKSKSKPCSWPALEQRKRANLMKQTPWTKEKERMEHLSVLRSTENI
jgi:hypothetical protein